MDESTKEYPEPDLRAKAAVGREALRNAAVPQPAQREDRATAMHKAITRLGMVNDRLNDLRGRLTGEGNMVDQGITEEPAPPFVVIWHEGPDEIHRRIDRMMEQISQLEDLLF